MTDAHKYSVKRCNNAIAACDTLITDSPTAEGKAFWAGKRVVWMDRLRVALKEHK